MIKGLISDSKIEKWPLFLLAVLLLTGCSYRPDKNENADLSLPALKEVFEDAFVIGAALNNSHITGEDVIGVSLVTTHYNTITPENVMKWEHINPEPGVYNFDLPDQFVQFGEENEMFMIGHTLVWHSQVPQWVFEDQSGNSLDRDALLERMRSHIHTVVGRYKGRIHAWDVVNEALNADGTLRQSRWLEIIGEDYLRKAFEYAHEADPDAELYYNDYSLENPAKREGAVELVQNLLDQGATITGVGTQGHFSLDWPSLEEAEATIVAFAELGVDVMVTELDIDVLPPAMDYLGADVSMNVELRDELNPWPEVLPDSVHQALAGRYADLFSIYHRHRQSISRITFWGVRDSDSWKNDWPVRGRTNYPLLFDRDGKPKPAFHDVVCRFQ